MSEKTLVSRGQQIMHTLSLFVVLAIGLGAMVYTFACALGFAPWLTYTATFGDTSFAQAGMYTQIGLTVLLAVKLSMTMETCRRFCPVPAASSLLRNPIEISKSTWKTSHAPTTFATPLTVLACSPCHPSSMLCANACLICAITRIWTV